MNQALMAELDQPVYRNGNPLLLAGLIDRYTAGSIDGIRAQWNRFMPQLDGLAGAGVVSYGVCFDMFCGARHFYYLTGVEVEDPSDLPAGFTRVRIAAHRYAVFPHHGHFTEIRGTVDAVWNTWLPDSGHAVADDFDFIERYDERFDACSGRGGIEVWVPVKG